MLQTKVTSQLGQVQCQTVQVQVQVLNNTSEGGEAMDYSIKLHSLLLNML